MSNKGYIKLYRDIQDHWIWQEEYSMAQAWLDLILMANHKNRKIPFNDTIRTIKRGQHLTSVRKLSARWGWGMNKTERFLKLLEADDMIRKESDRSGTLLTIVNYEVYQSSDTPSNTPTDTPTDTPMNTPTDTPTELNKNGKNDKNVKNDKKERGKAEKFIPPSVEEVRDYCVERQNGIDPEAFVNFYESKGWMIGKNKMKDWKRAVGTWERRRKEERPEEKPETDPKKAAIAKKVFLDDDAQWLAPFHGFPEEWFEGDKLVEERVTPLIRPTSERYGWYEETEVSAKDLIDDYKARKKYVSEHKEEADEFKRKASEADQ